MVDFKKINQDWWDKLSDEEKKAIHDRKERQRNSIIERIDFELNKDVGIDKCTAILRKDEENRLKFEVVDRHFKDCGDRVFWGYYYDNRFVQRILNNMEAELFRLDAGRDIGIKMVEMKEIIKIFENARLNKGWLLEDDYFPTVTEMCKGTALE